MVLIIILLTAIVGFLCYQWGYTDAEWDMREKNAFNGFGHWRK